MTAIGTELIWPAWPSTPPGSEDDHVDPGDLLIVCTDCGEEFFEGQSCRCSEPEMTDAERRHAEARRLHPTCEECRIGKGYVVPGPPHSKVHRGHCSCDGCW